MLLRAVWTCLVDQAEAVVTIKTLLTSFIRLNLNVNLRYNLAAKRSPTLISLSH
jgi:hypothetical protein